MKIGEVSVNQLWFNSSKTHFEGVSAAILRDELEIAVLRSRRLEGLRTDDGQARARRCRIGSVS